MKPYLCPYCGALKDRSVFVGHADYGGDDLGIMVCNACLGLIVWPLGKDPVNPRQATEDEVAEIMAAELGQMSYMHALRRRLERP